MELVAAEQRLFRSGLVGTLSSVFVFLSFLFSVKVLNSYGTGLFFGNPIVAGAVQAYFFNRPVLRSTKSTIGVVVLSLSIAGAAILLFALEGLVCLLMAAPVVLAGGALGAVVGRVIAAIRTGNSSWALLVLALPPALMAFEALPAPKPQREVVSSVEIAAPVDTVWQHVIAFGDLPPVSEALFRSGIAYPKRAHIEGEGVGRALLRIFYRAIRGAHHAMGARPASFFRRLAPTRSHGGMEPVPQRASSAPRRLLSGGQG